MAIVAWTQQTWIAMSAMFVAGSAWITTTTSLNVSLQLDLHDWVRARAMSTYQMAITGASAVGAAIWGQVATQFDLSTSLFLAAITGVVLMGLANRLMPDTEKVVDIAP